MIHFPRSLITLLTLAGPFCAPAGVRSQDAPAGWTPELMLKVRRLGSVRPSPDGRQVAYTVTVAVMTPERSENITRIFLSTVDGEKVRSLTREERSASDPQWSPDGSGLAFIYARQLFLTGLDGKPWEQLTEIRGGVAAYAWSPDGTRIAFTSPEPPSEARLQAIREKDDAYWVDEEVAQHRLYVVSLAPGTDGKREARPLTPAEFHVGPQLDWAPDGKSIVFARTPTSRPDDGWSSDVVTVEVETGTLREVAATPAIEAEARYSPDGKWIALVVSGEPPRYTQRSRLQLFPAPGMAGDGAPRTLPETPDSRPTLIGWSADGRELYFWEHRGTLVRIYAMAVETGTVRTVNEGGEYLSGVSLDPSRKWFGCVAEASTQAPEAAISPAAPFRLRRVTRANAHLPALPLGKTEIVRWKSDGEWEIEGLLTYPVGYTPGARVPLLLQIHGGPAGAFGKQYLARPTLYPTAAFAARGFAVLQPNPRGSVGYGAKFQDQNYRDWGGADYRDLMAGVDHLVKQGLADPDRLGIMGWSYGGYLTGWTITQTDRFKAASLGAGVSNLVSQTGTTDIPTQRLGYFGAWPWDDPRLAGIYLERSPLLHAAKVKTPTLIQHGELDRRVPITQGYEFYNALKKRGVPVRMLVLPRQAHGPSEPKMLLKVMNTNLAWFEQHLKPR